MCCLPPCCSSPLWLELQLTLNSNLLTNFAVFNEQNTAVHTSISMQIACQGGKCVNVLMVPSYASILWFNQFVLMLLLMLLLLLLNGISAHFVLPTQSNRHAAIIHID